MTSEEKNKYIEDYIRNISSKVNSQYGKVLINEEMIQSALSKFKTSPADLTTIIPQIDKSFQNIIDNYKQHQKILAEMSRIDATASFNPEQLNSNLRTNNQGVYLSSLMVTALSLINCSNIEEINKWLDSVPNLYMIQPYQNGDYSLEQIEQIKKDLFTKYQDSMVSTAAITEISRIAQKDARSYFLHKKLSGLNLSFEDELRLEKIGSSEGLPALYTEIEKICIEKFGREKGIIISKKVINYYTTDFENFNSSTYEQFNALNEEIKTNIQKCLASGGDFQFVISSLNYGNTVNDLGNHIYEYNFAINQMGQELAEKLGASCRLKCIINRNTAEEMIQKGFTKEDKEVVIQILRDSLTASLQSFNSQIKMDGKNRTFELFNELLEIYKDDKNYKYIWEDKFGITLTDLIEQVIRPNMGLIQELKAKNVDFIYSETLLQESREKRARVMETMIELQRLEPGLITIFGDQDHTFGEDYTGTKIDQLREVADFDKQMSEMVFGYDKNGRPIKVQLECTERDLYLSQSETQKLEQQGMAREDILKYKQALMNIHDEIFRDVPFRRECEWTVVDNLSGDYFDHNMDTKKDTFIGKYTKISAMARKDNSQRINQDLASFNKWQQAKQELEKQKMVENDTSKSNPENSVNSEIHKEEAIRKENKETTANFTTTSETEPQPFPQRSQAEIEIAEQIKKKNQMIKQQKEHQKQLEKQNAKKLILKNPNTANPNPNIQGSINVFIIFLVVSFACTLLLMIFYMSLGR